MMPLGPKALRAAKPERFPGVPTTLGEHVRRRRLELGLFQGEVATQLGVSEATVHHWETGKTAAPPVRVMPRILVFLGYDPYPEPRSLPERILAVRRRLGLSRRELARRIGVDPETLGR